MYHGDTLHTTDRPHYGYRVSIAVVSDKRRTNKLFKWGKDFKEGKIQDYFFNVWGVLNPPCSSWKTTPRIIISLAGKEL